MDCGETGWRRDGWLKILATAALLKATRPIAQQVAAASPACESPTCVDLVPRGPAGGSRIVTVTPLTVPQATKDPLEKDPLLINLHE